jgi:putative iron-regulated protein
MAYDQLIAKGNSSGNAKVMNVVEKLLSQTKAIETVTKVLGLDNIAFEGSDALDSPDSVFQ